jgi:hypothetical protein
MFKILSTLSLIAILLTSCNKAQEILIPKQDLAQETISPPVQLNSTIIPEVKPNTTTGCYPKTKAVIAATVIIAGGALVAWNTVRYYAGQIPIPTPEQINQIGLASLQPFASRVLICNITSMVQYISIPVIVSTTSATVCYAYTKQNKEDE